MAKVKSWWRLKQVRHRDAVVLSVLSASLLLAGDFTAIQALYVSYLAPVSGQPVRFGINLLLTVLAYTTTFGGVLVLLGGLYFSWGRIGRGRFLMSLGIGLSLLGLARQSALYILVNNPVALFQAYTGLAGIGLLIGVGSYTLMGEYALMLKKHAKRIYRRWRRARRAVEPVLKAPDEEPPQKSGPRRSNGRRVKAS
jgi:hypothetical protein